MTTSMSMEAGAAAQRFEFARDGRRVMITLECPDEATAKEFFRTLVDGAKLGVIELRMTVPPDHDGGWRPLDEPLQ